MQVYVCVSSRWLPPPPDAGLRLRFALHSCDVQVSMSAFLRAGRGFLRGCRSRLGRYPSAEQAPINRLILHEKRIMGAMVRSRMLRQIRFSRVFPGREKPGQSRESQNTRSRRSWPPIPRFFSRNGRYACAARTRWTWGCAAARSGLRVRAPRDAFCPDAVAFGEACDLGGEHEACDQT